MEIPSGCEHHSGRLARRCPLLAHSGHRFLRRICLLLTQSGHFDFRRDGRPRRQASNNKHPHREWFDARPGPREARRQFSKAWRESDWHYQRLAGAKRQTIRAIESACPGSFAGDRTGNAGPKDQVWAAGDSGIDLVQDTSQKSVREVIARAVSDPAAVLKGIGEPKRAVIQPLYQSSDLTILNVVWPASFTCVPHTYQMWAVIGVYTGREDNIFWRRLPESSNGRVEAAGARAICAKDAYPLGTDIIHSVTNPLSRLTSALQVYGGDLYSVIRSEWDAKTLCEQRVQAVPSIGLFEAAMHV